MSSLSHHDPHQFPENDVERHGELKATNVDVATENDGDIVPDGTNTAAPRSSNPQYENLSISFLLTRKVISWNAKVESLAGLEARGITRVRPEEKHEAGRNDYLQMFVLWFSINLVATNIITGLLGPLVFELGWVDCVCIVIFANAISAGAVSYISTFGPESGNRTMVRMRAECKARAC